MPPGRVTQHPTPNAQRLTPNAERPTSPSPSHLGRVGGDAAGEGLRPCKLKRIHQIALPHRRTPNAPGCGRSRSQSGSYFTCFIKTSMALSSWGSTPEKYCSGVMSTL